MKLALVDDDLFLEHAAPHGHVEREARLLAARRGLEAGSKPFELVRLPARDATQEEICRVHDTRLFAALEATAGSHGYIDSDTYYGPQSFAAARRAAGGAIALVEALAQGHDIGFGLLRPPGHHATSERAMGFCLLNSAAVAAEHAIVNGTRRVLIFDWDVHHGNGTQDIFYHRPDVLYVSLHQSPQYPGTGSVAEVGAGPGRGRTVNVPLSARASDAVYRSVMQRLIVPVVQQFRPELTIVSAGYDAHQRDLLGGMQLSDQGFGMLTALLMQCLAELGRCSTLFLLEGGYDEQALQGSIRETLLAAGRVLAGKPDQDVAASTCELPSPFEDQLLRAMQIQSQFWELAVDL